MPRSFFSYEGGIYMSLILKPALSADSALFITTAAAVSERIATIENSREVVFQIKQMFGFGARSLTKTEQAIFDKWTQTYGYGIDTVRLAYDIMINTIQRPVPKYADKITTYQNP